MLILRYHWCVFSLLIAPRIDERFRFADDHLDLERNIADFLSTEASTLYSQVSQQFLGDIRICEAWGHNCRRPRYRFCYSEGAYKFRALPFTGSSIMTSEVSKTFSSASKRNDGNTADLLQEYLLSQRTYLRRTAPWLIYQNL